MLVSRDAYQLADSLERLTGSKAVSQYLFGIGVVGMAVSTIIILMLINGFCLCEMFGAEPKGMVHRVGAVLPGLSGALGFILLWGDANARFWLAVPTSVFGMILLPIAYVTFFLMINSRNLLGDMRPKGGPRLVLNLAILVAIAAAVIGAGWSIWSSVQIAGVVAVGVFVALAVVVHFVRPPRKPGSPTG